MSQGESTQLPGDVLEELVERFAQIDVEGCLEDPTRLRAAMAERQAILTALQNTDTTQLTGERRSRLHERLRALIERNDHFLAKAAERMEEVRKNMKSMAPVRAAARGYAEFRAPQVSSLRRVG